VGSSEGALLGCSEGLPVGMSVGKKVGSSEGALLGCSEGLSVGMSVGKKVGSSEGALLGCSVAVGTSVGSKVGSSEGALLGVAGIFVGAGLALKVAAKGVGNWLSMIFGCILTDAVTSAEGTNDSLGTLVLGEGVGPTSTILRVGTLVSGNPGIKTAGSTIPYVGLFDVLRSVSTGITGDFVGSTD
jgi:hypothetical protein